MKLLLRSVTICSSGDPNHGFKKDILLSEGVISRITDAVKCDETGAEVIDCIGLQVSVGWFDLHVQLGEPGYEFREDFRTGTLAAMKGGFTGVLMMPGTLPPIDSKSGVEFIRNRTKDGLVEVVPAGCMTVGGKGNDLAELYDMWLSGARAFTDDQHPFDNAGMLQRALLYSKDFGGRVMVFAEDRNLAGKGQMHEGPTSTRLGLKGMPGLSESVMVSRDLQLLEYTGGSIHFSTVSTATTVELIRQARKKGMDVTADVSALHLHFTDEAMDGFDTNLKVKPPLRDATDREALIEGLIDGTIDAISSDHRPHDVEAKKKEFDLADFGAAGLETCYGAVNTALKGRVKTERIIDALSIKPRRILGLKVPVISEGQPANLTVFSAEKKWTVSQNDLRSKGCNNPFIGRELTGMPVMVIRNGIVSEC
ncbi:MAG: dihydroorotase [Bacteroidota bacterium]